MTQLHRPALVTETLYPGYVFSKAPRNVYWETTVACDLACRHCRASAVAKRHPDELTTEGGKVLLRDIRSMGSMVILTGGDPMARSDLFDLISYARKLGVTVAITPSTTPRLTRAIVQEFSRLGVAALGLSLDGPDAATHDAFRGLSGTFDRAVEVLEWAREYQLPVQVNTTVSSATIERLPELHRWLAEKARPPVCRWSLFYLVPVGRGKALGMPSANQFEESFAWLYEISKDSPFHVTTVEAPHYRRYWIQRREAEGSHPRDLARQAARMGFGIRDGNGIVFVSHTGDVYPAGFLPTPLLGNIKTSSLSDIYQNSAPLRALRNADGYGGKCGSCEYRWACGGSRARAFALTGDPLASDPSCTHLPLGDPRDAQDDRVM